MWSCLALVAAAPAQSHEVKLLPYLLGTAPRSPKWLARHNKNDRKKFRQATCSFGTVGFLDNLARLVFVFRNIVNSCPQSVIDSQSYQPGEEASLPVKVCLLSVSALFGGLAQTSRALTVLASTCARTATVEEGCAASIETLLVPVTLWINGGIAISAACDKGAVDLPKDIQPNRRLMDPRDLPVKRQWDIAQCTFDAIDASRAIAGLGLSLDAMTRSCPVNRATRFTEKLSTAACTVDVSVVMTSFIRLVFYLALAVNHCSPEPERDAICLVGVSAIAAGMSTSAAGGAGTYATCDMGKKRQRRERLVAAGLLNASDAGVAGPTTIDAAPFQLVRRLIKPRRLQGSLQDVEETFLKLGYNLSDPSAKWLVQHENPELLEALKLNSGSSAPPVKRGTSEVPCGTASADVLHSRSAVSGEPMSLEDNATRCQARCFRIPSCSAFAFWAPGGQCHVLGFLEMPLVQHRNDTPGWLSGPPSCGKMPGTTAALRQMMAQRHEACYSSHAVYQPLLEDLQPRSLPTVLDCQQWCQQQSQCHYFSYFASTGLCHLSPSRARSLGPALNFVSGPKTCEEEFIVETTEMRGMHVAALGQGTLAVGFVSLLSLSLLAMRMCIPGSMLGFKSDAEPEDALPLASTANGA